MLWGSSIVGFGKFMVRYANSKQAEWMIVGFAPRAKALSLYLHGNNEEGAEILARLGKHSCGMGCLYIKKLADVRVDVLREMIEEGVQRVRTASELTVPM